MADDRGASEAIGGLLDVSHLAPVDDLAPLAAEHAQRLGAHGLVVYLLDYAQQLLVPVPRHAVPGLHPATDGAPLAVETTLAGRALTTQQILVGDGDGDGDRVYLPLADGTDRVGLASFTTARFDEADVPTYRRFGALLASLIVNKAQYGDLFFFTRRRRPMTIAAQMQWRMLPPLHHATARVTVAGVLEPAYQVGGDTFDYALNDGVLHIGVFDAMGHGLDACLMSTVAVSSYRHSRRAGLDLGATAYEADNLVADRFGEDSFVTAQLASLDTATGRLRWINAGHPPPLLVRANRVVGALPSEPTLPLGIGFSMPGTHLEATEEALEPEDVILFYTDGMVEARRAGEEFGLERLTDWLHRELDSGMELSEVLRRLSSAVLEHHNGTLQDDATMVAMHWRGAEPTSEPHVVGLGDTARSR